MTALLPHAPEETPPTRRPAWLLPFAALVVVVLAVGAVVLALYRVGEDATTATTAPAPAASPSAPATAPPTTPAAPAVADCSVAPDAADFTVGTNDPCFTAMGERLLLWLGANTAPAGEASTPTDTFTQADGTNVANVQRLMGDEPDGWLGQDQWTRLMTQPAPPVTELRANGIGPLWFGMTGAQVTASGVARVVAGTAEAPASYVELTSVAGAGCNSSDGAFRTFATHDPQVRTPEGISARSTLADVQAAYGSAVRVVTLPSAPRDVTLYVVPEDEFALAFWAPGPDVGIDEPLVLYAGDAGSIDQLHPQSGWCFD